jgi:hypothetical protein
VQLGQVLTLPSLTLSLTKAIYVGILKRQACARNEETLSMPTLQESGPAHCGDSFASESDNKSPLAVDQKKEFFFTTTEAGMCMKTNKTALIFRPGWSAAGNHPPALVRRPLLNQEGSPLCESGAEPFGVRGSILSYPGNAVGCHDVYEK